MILVAFVFTFGLGVIVFKSVNNFFQLNFFFHKLFKLDGDCHTLWCFGIRRDQERRPFCQKVKGPNSFRLLF